MLNTNIQIESTSSNMNALLEAFFCVQPNEHIKAWRWHQFTRNSNVDAIDAALAKAAKELRDAKALV